MIGVRNSYTRRDASDSVSDSDNCLTVKCEVKEEKCEATIPGSGMFIILCCST